MTSTLSASQPPRDAAGAALTFATHVRQTLKLAVPMIIARAGLLIMVAVDTAMVGHYGTNSLAHYAAANALQIILILVGVGLTQGTVIMVAQAVGAGDERTSGHIWRVGMVQGTVFGVLMGVLCLFGEPILLGVGQTPELAAGGGGVLQWISWGFPAFMMWATTGFFLEGLGRPLPGMIMMFGAVLLNAFLNWVFIFGHLGAPAMGAEGAAITTSVVRWIMLAALIAYVLWLPDGHKLGIRGPIEGALALARKHRRIGYPLGLARGLEVAAFSALTMFAGWLGTVSLAGYQIAFNLIGLAFMCAIGTSSATTVRVGNAIGRGNAIDVSRAGWAGVLIIIVIMLCIMGPYMGLGHALASIYSDDPAVIPVAAGLIAITGLVLVFDGVQAVLMGCLRGSADVWFPSALQLLAWWGLSVPIGWALAFPGGAGANGLMWAVLVGAFAAAVSLGVRFRTISRRPGRRI